MSLTFIFHYGVLFLFQPSPDMQPTRSTATRIPMSKGMKPSSKAVLGVSAVTRIESRAESQSMKIELRRPAVCSSATGGKAEKWTQSRRCQTLAWDSSLLFGASPLWAASSWTDLTVLRLFSYVLISPLLLEVSSHWGAVNCEQVVIICDRHQNKMALSLNQLCVLEDSCSHYKPDIGYKDAQHERSLKVQPKLYDHPLLQPVVAGKRETSWVMVQFRLWLGQVGRNCSTSRSA